LDQKANNISFGTAYLSGNLVLKGFEAKIDFSFKRNFEYIDIGSSFTPLGSKVGKSGLHFRQLYVAYNFKKTRWVIGQYESNIGSETMVQPQTLFYSLSYAFSNSPLYHRGIKTEIKLSNDYRKEDIYVKNVNIHSQVIYKPIKKLDFSFGVYRTNVPVGKTNLELDYDYSWSNFKVRYHFSNEYAATFSLMSGAKVSGSFYYGFWNSFLFDFEKQISENSKIAFRYENFNNDGAIMPMRRGNNDGVKVNTFTIAGNVKLCNFLLIKPEYRIDRFNQVNFSNTLGEAFKVQSTVGLGLIFILDKPKI
jgi:hypothetical protein